MHTNGKKKKVLSSSTTPIISGWWFCSERLRFSEIRPPDKWGFLVLSFWFPRIMLEYYSKVINR